MTRSHARELAAHLIYDMDYTGQSAAEAIDTRLDAEYYAGLGEEHEIYLERPNRKQLAYIQRCIEGVDANRETLRATIGSLTVGWKVERLSRFVLAVLELAMYELLNEEDVPDGVTISEAVILTKKYEDDEVGAFVNGILGNFVRGGKALVKPCADEAPAEVPAQ